MPPLADVEYRDIPEFPGYRAGSDGSIWSGKWGTWRRLQGAVQSQGYVNYALRRGSRYVNRRAHQLILATFVGPCPAGMECCHNNGIRHDNRVENLRYDTRQSNRDDELRHGTRRRGVQRWNAKLDDDKVREIKKLLARQYAPVEVASIFGVCEETIRRIAKGEGWAHVV